MLHDEALPFDRYLSLLLIMECYLSRETTRPSLKTPTSQNYATGGAPGALKFFLLQKRRTMNRTVARP
jgi:hypothetical protein